MHNISKSGGKHSARIRDIVAMIGPCLTSDIIAVLQEQGVSPTAASQRIRRARRQGDVECLDGLPFKGNAKFVYTRAQRFTSPGKYWKKFWDACYRAGKGYWVAMTTLEGRGGICPVALFSRISGAPAGRKCQMSPSEIRNRLLLTEVLQKVEWRGRTYVQLYPNSWRKYSEKWRRKLRAVEAAEAIALETIRNWVKHVGLGSYGKVEIRDDDGGSVHEVSGIAWDLTAPICVRPFHRLGPRGIGHSLLACDINLLGIMREPEAEAFVRKCDMAAGPSQMARVLPMVVARKFSKSAYNYLKKNRVLGVTLDDLLGRGFLEAIDSLVSMLAGTDQVTWKDTHALFRNLETYTRFRGEYSNMRGIVFELVAACVVSRVYGDGETITREPIVDSNGDCIGELDALFIPAFVPEVIVVECKSKSPGQAVGKRVVKDWFDKVPRIYGQLCALPQFAGRRFRFQLWTNSKFRSADEKWIREQVAESTGGFDTVPYSIELVSGAELARLAEQSGDETLLEILQRFYFRGEPWDD